MTCNTCNMCRTAIPDVAVRVFNVDREILPNWFFAKIIISKWTMYPKARCKLEQATSTAMTDFIYNLKDIIGLKDEIIIGNHFFILTTSTPESWAVVEHLVIEAFKEAYGFDAICLTDSA